MSQSSLCSINLFYSLIKFPITISLSKLKPNIYKITYTLFMKRFFPKKSLPRLLAQTINLFNILVPSLLHSTYMLQLQVECWKQFLFLVSRDALIPTYMPLHKLFSGHPIICFAPTAGSICLYHFPQLLASMTQFKHPSNAFNSVLSNKTAVNSPVVTTSFSSGLKNVFLGYFVMSFIKTTPHTKKNIKSQNYISLKIPHV